MTTTEIKDSGPKRNVESYEDDVDLVVARPPKTDAERDKVREYFRQWPYAERGPQWLYVACRFAGAEGYVAVFVEPGEVNSLATYLDHWGFVIREFCRWQRTDAEDRGFLIATAWAAVDRDTDMYSVEADGAPVPVEVWRHIIDTWSDSGDRILDPFLWDCNSVEAARDREFVGISHDPVVHETAHRDFETRGTNAMKW